MSEAFAEVKSCSSISITTCCSSTCFSNLHNTEKNSQRKTQRIRKKEETRRKERKPKTKRKKAQKGKRRIDIRIYGYICKNRELVMMAIYTGKTTYAIHTN